MPIRRSSSKRSLHAALDDVLQVDDAEHEVVLRDDERRAAGAGDRCRRSSSSSAGDAAALLLDEALDRVGGALAELLPFDVDAAHPRRRREGDERRLVLAELALAQAEPLLREHDDRAALGRLVGERRELRDLGQLGSRDAVDGDELRRPGGCRA